MLEIQPKQNSDETLHFFLGTQSTIFAETNLLNLQVTNA